MAALCASPAVFAPRRAAARPAARGRLSCRAVKVGDQLPDVKVSEGTPNYGAGTEVSVRNMFAGKRGILFAVPGAFTPGCSKSHLPSFVRDSAKLKEMGVDVVACVATNDHWVMHAWGESQGAGGKVRMLSDADGSLTKALGQEMSSGVLTRSKRYSMIIVDNRVATFNAEADGGFDCTLSNLVMEQLPKVLAESVDPLDAYCASDPSADECRVYSD